jgi:phenylalanyl-tRNA synthetase beta chain
VGRLTGSQPLRRRLEDALRDRGLHECISYSFTSPEKLARLRLGDDPVLRLDNPLNEELSVMRPLLLPGLLDAAAHNAAHGRPGVALFESAHVYGPDGALDDARDESPDGALPAAERHHLSVAITEAASGGWRSEPVPADFHAVRGILDAVLATAGAEASFELGERPFLHPGRAADVLAADGRRLGFAGELHPRVADAWDLAGPVAVFELDVELLADLAPGGVGRYRDISGFPVVLQDIAVVVPEDVAAAEVVSTVEDAAGELLESTEIFDLYRGEQVGEGNRSLAIRLRFRAPDRTLTDDEVAARRAEIETALEGIGGRLRA